MKFKTKVKRTNFFYSIYALSSFIFGFNVLTQEENRSSLLNISDIVTGKVDDRIFGQFLERPSWGGEFGPEVIVNEKGELPENVIEMIKYYSPPLVRFPGGTDIDYIDWKDMIDNVPGRETKERPKSKGHCGDLVTNRFGLHEFFSLRDKVGFEVMLCVNLRDALYKKKPLKIAANDAAGLLAYCNLTEGTKLPEGMYNWPSLRALNGSVKPFFVKYIMVGNESYFYWPPKKDEDLKSLNFNDNDEAWDWCKECLIAYGKALKSIDPNIELAIDGLHDPWNPANNKANNARRKIFISPEIRDLYKHLCSHNYAPMNSWTPKISGKKFSTSEISDIQLWYGIVSAPGLIDEGGQNIAFGNYYDEFIGLGYKVAVTEWNWNGWGFEDIISQRPFGIETPSMLATAGFLNGMLRNADKISLATQSMFLGSSWGITAIRVDPEGKIAPYWFPQGQVSWFYRKYCGDKLVKSSLQYAPFFENPPQFAGWWPPVKKLSMLDAVVTKDDKRIFVHVINRSYENDLALEINLPSANLSGKWNMFTLSHEPKTPWFQSNFIKLKESSDKFSSGIFKIKIPKHSVNVIVVNN